MKHSLAFAFLILTVSIGCHSEAPAPTSIEEFSSVFQGAYDNGDEGAISRLVYQANVDSELLEIQLSLLTIFLGENTITEISATPFDPNTPNNPVYGREIELNIAPTHMLSIKHQGNAGFEGSESSGAASMPVGQKDGKYYFCGWAYKK